MITFSLIVLVLITSQAWPQDGTGKMELNKPTSDNPSSVGIITGATSPSWYEPDFPAPAEINADLPQHFETPGSASIISDVIAIKQQSPSQIRKEGWFEFDSRPRPEIYANLYLNGEGYAIFSQSITGGVSIESRHLMLEGTATYDNSHKANDGTGNNPKGHIRTLDANAYYRLPNYWFVGSAGGWSQLSTTNYKKGGFNFELGVGTDYVFKDESGSMRAIISYGPPLLDKVNGSQSIAYEVMIPSPLSQHHVIFTMASTVLFFHTTITEPTNAALTALQKSHRFVGDTSSFGLLFRF
jgi:hypothetical protein